jgi:hypothetical protein
MTAFVPTPREFLCNRTRRERRGESASPDVAYRDCNRCIPCAGSLSLGR